MVLAEIPWRSNSNIERYRKINKNKLRRGRKQEDEE
jgi:hypothetical protein